MFWRWRRMSDFSSEIQSHIAMETDRLQGQGMSFGEARAAALREFGNPTASAERFFVPLKTMCSTKCEMPFEAASSSREPVFTHMPMEMERMCCISSVMTVSPLGNTRR